jgi:uncharacterized protein (TIGR00251 family)
VLHIDERDDSITIPVKVRPRSRHPGILGVRGEALLVGVSAPPEQGKANRALIQLLAQTLAIPRGSVEIVSGQSHPHKVVRCRGISATDAHRRLGLSAPRE